MYIKIKYCHGNKCQRKPKGQSRIDNPETLATQGTQDTGQRQTKQKKHNAIYVRQDYTQTNTNNVNKTYKTP